MIDSRPIPALAQTALAFLNASYRRQLDDIGRQTVDALGLSQADNWTVDFDRGVMTREIADPLEPKA